MWIHRDHLCVCSSIDATSVGFIFRGIQSTATHQQKQKKESLILKSDQTVGDQPTHVLRHRSVKQSPSSTACNILQDGNKFSPLLLVCCQTSVQYFNFVEISASRPLHQVDLCPASFRSPWRGSCSNVVLGGCLVKVHD